MASFGKVFFLLLFSAVSCVKWSASPADGVTVYVCQGQDLSLPWDITTDGGEQVIEITWFFHGHSEQMIAVYSHGMFLPTPSYAHRVGHLPAGGLNLSHVTLGDAGNYTVEINVDDGKGVLTKYRHSATVHVASDISAEVDATLDVRQHSNAVYDNRTDQFHVQLTCTSHGWQPPAIIWTTPTGQTLPSSSKVGDTSTLLLPNPVTGGNYTCRLPSDSPAAKCLPPNDPALEGATVHVDKTEARLLLLEAGQTALMQENKELKKENEGLKALLTDVETAGQISTYRTLVQRIQELENIESIRVSFHAALFGNQDVTSGAPIIPTTVSTNQGNGYNPTSGQFTVPVNGTYFFIVTTSAYTHSTTEDHYASLYLTVDGTENVTYVFTKSVNYLEQGTCSYVGHMTQGQRVWMKAAKNSHFSGSVTTFSGFLIAAD